MRKYILFIALFFVSSQAFSQKHIQDSLAKWSEAHQFVKMDSINNKYKTKDYFFYKALYANVCNNPLLSNVYLDSIKKRKTSKTFKFYKLKNDNFIKLFDYKNAYRTAKILTSIYIHEFDSIKLKAEFNTKRIWEVLKNSPAQKIIKFDSVTIPTFKDKAGLMTMKVTANDIEINFVFDTGAGLNCITESLAKKLGFKILLDNNIVVKSFTGVDNKVLIGVAPILQVGAIKIHDAVFLVYPDNAFTFAKGAYVINGIIGFPIAKELGTIIITKDKLTIMQKSADLKYNKNLFIDELRAIVMLRYKGKSNPFNFDSGAKASSFTKSFYEAYQSNLQKNGRIIGSKTSGAGGQEVNKQVLEIQNQEMYLDKTKIKFSSMLVNKFDYGIYGKVNFGNIGQDVLSQFDKITISFDNNYLKLEN